MDKKEFKTRILELGQLRRAYSGFSPENPEAYEDQVFIPAPQERRCEDCGLMVIDRRLTYEAKINSRGQLKFRTKCRVRGCGAIWLELRL